MGVTQNLAGAEAARRHCSDDAAPGHLVEGKALIARQREMHFAGARTVIAYAAVAFRVRTGRRGRRVRDRRRRMGLALGLGARCCRISVNVACEDHAEQSDEHYGK